MSGRKNLILKLNCLTLGNRNYGYSYYFDKIMTTKAAILYQLNAPLVIEDLEIPSLGRGQVLVKLKCSGICRAQLNEMIGLKGPDRFLPHLLGHEGSALVEEIGTDVTRVKKGDYVALSWIKGDGLDASGTQYKAGKRKINAGPVTTFNEYSVVAENRLTRIPKTMPADHAALLGCAIATGGGIVINRCQVKPNDTIAIFGVGGVGASAILAAKMQGLSTIIAVDIHDSKLEFARSLGATDAVHFQDKHIVAKIQKITGGGVDYAIDASGVKQAIELAFDCLRQTGMLVIAGNIGKEEKISIHPFELIKGKRIVGTWGGETLPQRDLPRYVKAYQSGRLPIEQLITHRIRLEEINEGFEILKRGEAGRIVIEF